MGDYVRGDKFHGDKINGDKIEGDKIGRDHVVNNYGSDVVRPGYQRHQGDDPPVVLMMSANPYLEASLRLDVERRQIDQAIVRARAEHRLAFEIADAVRLDDLSYALLRYRPAIAHFSGHGTAVDGLAVTDDAGYARLVPPDALADLFGILNGGLRCVVLNACYSAEQARMIAQHVPFVVGMRHGVDDDEAILFSAGFYEGIAHGRSVRDSFALGRTRLRLYGYTGQGPVLVAADNASDEPIVPRS